MMIITHQQNKYVEVLEGGEKTTREVAECISVTMASAGKMLHRLVLKGIVISTRMQGVYGFRNVHSLVMSYNELINQGMVVKNYHNNGNNISREEILYAAILRNAGLTGRELYAQYQKLYQHRTASSISGILMKARRKKLCR